jgi:hypothetical protein
MTEVLSNGKEKDDGGGLLQAFTKNRIPARKERPGWPANRGQLMEQVARKQRP